MHVEIQKGQGLLFNHFENIYLKRTPKMVCNGHQIH
jgi:hypothetical protein